MCAVRGVLTHAKGCTKIINEAPMRNRRFAILIVSLSLACLRGNAQSAPLGENAPELFEKGMNALQGSRTTRSIPNAVDYFRRSAELGFAPAEVVLGYFYDTGHAVTADPREALEWYKKAGQQDDPLAQWLVGRIIDAGLVPPRDLNEARKWLEKSSAHGDPFADYLLGKIALERSDYARSASEFRQSRSTAGNDFAPLRFTGTLWRRRVLNRCSGFWRGANQRTERTNSGAYSRKPGSTQWRVDQHYRKCWSCGVQAWL